MNANDKRRLACFRAVVAGGSLPPIVRNQYPQYQQYQPPLVQYPPFVQQTPSSCPTCPSGQHYECVPDVNSIPPLTGTAGTACPAGQHYDATQKKCVPDTHPHGPYGILAYDNINGVKTQKPLNPLEQQFVDVLNDNNNKNIPISADQKAIYGVFGGQSPNILTSDQYLVYTALHDNRPLTPAQQAIAFYPTVRDGTKPAYQPPTNPSATSSLPPTRIPPGSSNPIKNMFPPTTSSLPPPPPTGPSGLKDMFPYGSTPTSLNPPTPGSSFLPPPVPPPDVPVPPDITTPHVDPTPPGPSVGCGSSLDPQCPTYHPNHSIPGLMSQVDTINTITAFVNSKGYRHDPDGVPYISHGSWIPWDGVTTINPCTSTTAQISAFVFPPPGGSNCMRGLRDLFYQIKPFADNSNPTVAEIENWNIEVIRLFRRLLGFNQTTHPVFNDKCTFLKAAWSNERDHTNYWSASYPGSLDGPYGPCTLPKSSNPHCGASFIPTPTDQTPYLCPPTMDPCQPNTITGGTEGVSSHNEDIPWCCKMSRIISAYLGSDGIGGHTGPFIGRHCFGSSWWLNPSKPGVVVVRDKWTGPLAATCP